MAGTTASNSNDSQPTQEYQAAQRETMAFDSTATMPERQPAFEAPMGQHYSGQQYASGDNAYANAVGGTASGSTRDGDFRLGGYVPPTDKPAKSNGQARFWIITAAVALVCGLVGGALSGFGVASMATPSHRNERSQTSGDRGGQGMGEPMEGNGMPGSGSQQGGSGSRRSGGSQSESGSAGSQSDGNAQGLDSQGGFGSGSSDSSSSGNSSSPSSSSTRSGMSGDAI